ncbi:MAG TPA: hypothetical protein RMH99_26075 [Sandaracinaceae bacterium LLY-WYZ-13_1]|nr:hypothetical protein [Sandaracinaceae bacterium LLY-WYZ-13_1]
MPRFGSPFVWTTSLAIVLAGCGGGLRTHRVDEHVVRIDERGGRSEARVFVDGCELPGLYYDEERGRWGVEGYTHGPAYYELEVLGEDFAAWGAASWCEPGRAPPGLARHAGVDGSS